jgi:hypothetical protein
MFRDYRVYKGLFIEEPRSKWIIKFIKDYLLRSQDPTVWGLLG